MKYYPFRNPTKYGYSYRFRYSLFPLLHCFSPEEEKGVRKIPKSSCSYENVHCLVKLQVHRLELHLFLFHILKNVLCPSP